MRQKRKSWTSDEIKFIKENYGFLNYAELARKLKRPVGSVYNKIKRDQIPKIPTQKEYAVYHDDTFMVLGNANQCADYLGINVETFYTYRSRKRHNKLIIIDLGYWEKE